MLKLEQYQKLKTGDQIRFSKDIYTVHGHDDFGTHRECQLISEDGKVLHNGIYIIHLMAYHGSVDADELRPHNVSSQQAQAPLINLQEVRVAPAQQAPAMLPGDQALLDLYSAAERV